MNRIGEIRKRAKEATPPPWIRRGPQFFNCGPTIWHGDRRLFGNQFECTEADFDLVQHAASDIAYLLDVIDRS